MGGKLQGKRRCGQDPGVPSRGSEGREVSGKQPGLLLGNLSGHSDILTDREPWHKKFGGT